MEKGKFKQLPLNSLDKTDLWSHIYSHIHGTPRLESRVGVSSTVRRRLKTREAEVTVLKIHIDTFGFRNLNFCFWNPEFRVLESVFWLKDFGIPLTIGLQNPSSHMTRN